MSALTAILMGLALAVPTQEGPLLPGIANLPLIPGSETCGAGAPEGFDTADLSTTCITLPLEAANDAAWTYVGIFRERGWRFAGGAAIVLYVQRDKPNGGGCEGVDIAVLTDFEAMESGRLTDEEMAAMPAFVMFGHRKDVRCYGREQDERDQS